MNHTIIAGSDIARLAPIVLTRFNHPADSGSDRIGVIHRTPLVPQFTVSTTTPGADHAASAPLGSFSSGKDLGSLEVPPGDHQVRVTLPDEPGVVVFDSGSVIP